MKRTMHVLAVAAFATVTVASGFHMTDHHTRAGTTQSEPTLDAALGLFGNAATGQQIFRYATMGDERLWTDTLGLHEVIESAIDPITALSLGLKVDIDAIPQDLQDALAAGEVDLEDPQTTLALLSMNAVVGVLGEVEERDDQLALNRFGISCALCHSTVDDSFAPGIGHRLDGWANVDINPGAIIAASPAISQEAREVFLSWGPGKYDARFNIDGINDPAVIPPAYGLNGVGVETFTGDGPITYWNSYVAVTQMGAQGTFVDPDLGIEIVHTPDRVSPMLHPLESYQLNLDVPSPPPGSFDRQAANAGEQLFNGAARCSECHVPPLYTDAHLGILHAPEETGVDPTHATRSLTGQYRTTPLRGLFQHPPYFHDGSAPTLLDVVEHYNDQFKLELRDNEKDDLVEFLKSL